MAKLVKRRVVEETAEVPVEEDELDGADEAENDDEEIVEEESEQVKVTLGGAKKPRTRVRWSAWRS